MTNSPNLDPSAAWSKFFKATNNFYNKTKLTNGEDRRQIAQDLDDETDPIVSSLPKTDIITIDGIEDQNNKGEDVKISKKVLQKWAKEEIAVGKAGIKGESFKLLSSIGLTAARSDTFQLYNETEMKAFQSVEGYAEANEIKAKVVDPSKFEGEKPYLTAENTPLKAETIKAIPEQVTKAQAEQQAQQSAAAQAKTTETQAGGNERTSKTQADETGTQAEQTKKTSPTQKAQEAKQNQPVTQTKINGNPENINIPQLIQWLTSTLNRKEIEIEVILALMAGQEVTFDNQKLQVSTEDLRKALKPIFDDPTQRTTFIAKFTTKDQVEALRTFLGNEKSDELWDKLSEDQKTRLNNLLRDNSTTSTNPEAEADAEVDPNKLVAILVKSSINGQLIA